MLGWAKDGSWEQSFHSVTFWVEDSSSNIGVAADKIESDRDSDDYFSGEIDSWMHITSLQNQEHHR